MVRSKLRIVGLVTVVVTVLVWLAGAALDSSAEERRVSAAERGARTGRAGVQSFTLNALDYRLNIYNFYKPGLGYSEQIDEVLREYVGNLLFTGDSLTVLENERYSGKFVDLGIGPQPDTEFAPFHALRVYKRRFQIRQFPFVDRYLPYEAVEPTEFFAESRDPVTSVRLKTGHVYLLRLFHRTRVAEDRVFLLKTIEFVPDVKVTVLYRELEDVGFDRG
jgi:hypothetical protein